MSEIQSLPSYNPSDACSAEGNMNIFKNYLLKLIECSIPCVVQSYDFNSNMVTVLPAINVPTTTGEYLQRGVIKISAWKFHAGGFQIHYPIKAGDTGWIIAGDNDTTLFKQEKGVSDPNTYQKHKYQFGFFIPDAISGFNVSQDDKDRLVLQNDAGTEKISIGENDTKIKTTKLSIIGDVEITGTLTATTDVVADTISLKQHIHTGGTIDGKTGTPESAGS